MKKILSLGEYYISDFLKPEEQPLHGKYSLDLYLDEKIGAVRLNNIAPPEAMWGKYWYRSGINQSMTRELNSIVDQITSRVKYQKGDV